MVITRKHWLFIGLVTFIVTCDFFLVHLPYRTESDLQAVDFGIAMDFMLVIPFVYYIVLVRNTHRHWTTVIYVSFVFGHLLQWRVHSPNLHILIYPVDCLFVIVELRLFMRLVRVGQTYRRIRTSSDLPRIEVLGSAINTHLGTNPFFRYLATDLALLYYSLGSWGRKQYAPPGTRAFSYDSTSNAWIVLIVMSKVLLLEGFATHMIVQHWSGIAAWILTAGNIYLWLFLLGDYRAMRLNPIILSDSSLRVNYGLRFNITIPVSEIRSAMPVSNLRLSKAERKQALVYEPNIHIVLQRPFLAGGPFGLQKRVTDLYIHLDQPEVFARSISKLKNER